MKRFLLIILVLTICTISVLSATYKVTSGGTVKGPNGQIQGKTTSSYQQINTYRATSVANNPNNVVNNARQADIVELVVDYSGSMYGWIAETKAALNSILAGMAGAKNLGVRVFGNDIPKETIVKSIIRDARGKYTVQTKTNELTVNSCKFTKQIVPIGTHSSNDIIAQLDSVRLGGSTPLTLGLQQTVSQDLSKFPYNLKKKIVLLTDGGENCGGDPCAYINSLVAQRKDITVDVIYTGGGYSNLACLTKATGGRFYNIRDAYQFQNVLYNSVNDVNPQSVTPQTQTGTYNQSFEFVE